MVGPIILAIVSIICIGLVIWLICEFRGGYETIFGILTIVFVIGLDIHIWEYHMCHECYHAISEKAYCDNCGNPSEHYEPTLICPDCNVEVDREYCENCGISREEIEKIGDEKIENVPICAECDMELPDEAKFCPECGAARNVLERDLVCSNCGNGLETEDQYCSECGIALND